ERDDVEPQVELHPRGADRLLAALVHLALLRARLLRPHQPAEDEVRGQERQPRRDEDQDDENQVGHSRRGVRRQGTGASEDRIRWLVFLSPDPCPLAPELSPVSCLLAPGSAAEPPSSSTPAG